MFGFAVASGNESIGVGWTNAVNINNLSSTSASGYYINEYAKIPTKIVVNTTMGYKGKIVNLIAKLKDNENTPISSETVKFSVNGIFVGNTITDASGIATLPYTITQNSGIYTILTQFLENTIYTTSNNTNNLNIDPTPTNIIMNPIIGFKGKIVNLIAKLKDNNNQPLSNKTIKFSIYGTNIGNGVTNTLGIAKLPYTILQNKGTYTILAEFLQNNTYATSKNTTKLTVDNTAPSASATQKGGYYNTTTIVILKMSEIGTIYYTLNSTNPNINSSKYITKLLITSNKTLKYLAIDLAGNKSPIYSQIYFIDKIAPKVSLTSPTNNAVRVSLTSPITIKFSENIAAGINYSKIYVKNLNTGKIISTTKILSFNTLIIKMSSRSHNTTYVVYLPSNSIKDKSGNNLNISFNFKFKTL
ncbi:Ig-like domain-containing protein [Methanobacterium sp. SMA-27]|uniref:Ig-like domain-containing protein n=1 Tax=Methanobacterium sp. SMA-27 TaxID=1495336 RepID=UPI00064F6AF4|nr:Ig-like domain repeat protein [Methanobacterium sp. SMA-27]